MNVGDATLLGKIGGPAVKANRRGTVLLFDHLDLGESQPGRPAGSQRLEHRFFCGKKTRKVLGQGAVCARFDLSRPANTPDESLPVEGVNSLHPINLDHIEANAEDSVHRYRSAGSVSFPGRTARGDRF